MIFNMGGGIPYEVPTLEGTLPGDAAVVEAAQASAEFCVAIAAPGFPEEHRYQWYMDNEPIAGATEAGCTVTGLAAAGVHSVYCVVTSDAGSVTSRVATLTVQSSQPSYDFTGAHELVQEGDYGWKLKLLSSGVLRFSHLGTGHGALDIFCVGGGGGGSLAGGGGGYTSTESNKIIELRTDYTITIGAGGGVGAAGGTTSFGSLASAEGGQHGYYTGSNKGGIGGCGGGGYGGEGIAGNGGSDGGDGEPHKYQAQSSDGSWKWKDSTTGGGGQGSTTREFGEETGTLYAGGGGGGNNNKSHNTGGYGGDGGGGHGAGRGRNSSLAATDGETNTGGGGGGGFSSSLASKAGGSGIIVIRNHREVPA